MAQSSSYLIVGRAGEHSLRESKVGSPEFSTRPTSVRLMHLFVTSSSVLMIIRASDVKINAMAE